MAVTWIDTPGSTLATRSDLIRLSATAPGAVTITAELRGGRVTETIWDGSAFSAQYAASVLDGSNFSLRRLGGWSSALRLIATEGGLTVGTWAVTHTLTPSYWSDAFIAFNPSGTVGLVSGAAPYCARYASGVWTEFDLDAELGGFGFNVTDLAWLDDDLCVVVGVDGGGDFAAAHTEDGGVTWTLDTVPSVPCLRAVCAAEGGAAWRAWIDEDGIGTTSLVYTTAPGAWVSGGAGPVTTSLSRGYSDIGGAGQPAMFLCAGGYFCPTGAGVVQVMPGTGTTYPGDIARKGSDLWIAGVDDFGAGNDHAMWKSDDDGATWTLQTVTGFANATAIGPQCMVEVGGNLVVGFYTYAAATCDALYWSADGLAWTGLPDSIGLVDPVTPEGPRGLAYDGATIHGVHTIEFIFASTATVGGGSGIQGDFSIETPTPIDETAGEDHVAAALRKLILYFQKKPRIQSFLEGFSARVQTLEDLIWDVYTLGWDPATLGGVHLDALGRLVGEPRLDRTDAQYRPGIKVRQIVNASHGRHSDLTGIIETLLPDLVTLSITDYPPAAVLVEILADLSNIRLADLTRYLNQARAGGVRLQLVTADSADALIFSTVALSGTADLAHGFGDVALTVGGLMASGG